MQRLYQKKTTQVNFIKQKKFLFLFFLCLVFSAFRDSVGNVNKNFLSFETNTNNTRNFATQEKFQNGLDVLLNEKVFLIRDKKVALVINQSSLTSQGKHALSEISKLAQVVYVYAPEHGLKGKQEAGKKIQDDKNQNSNYKIISLYGGKFSAPSLQELKNIDMLIYDIQTTADRFYTYTTTLYRIMFLCAQSGTRLMILDRPLLNPDNGILGPQLLPPWQSFVGALPLPMHYALTNAELTLLLNQENFLGLSPHADITLIPMRGYRRNMTFQETGSLWISPSPNIADVATAKIYSGMVLLEGTNISEGRGTPRPFLTIGAPFINAPEWLAEIPTALKKDFLLHEISFTPRSDYRARSPKYVNMDCKGISIALSMQKQTQADSLELALGILWAAAKLYPQFQTRKFLDTLWGSEILRMALDEVKEKKIGYRQFREKISFDNADFEKVRSKYFLYR